MDSPLKKTIVKRQTPVFSECISPAPFSHMIRRFSTAGADDLSRLEEPENDRENDCEHQASDD